MTLLALIPNTLIQCVLTCFFWRYYKSEILRPCQHRFCHLVKFAAAPKVKFRPKRLCLKPSVVVQAVTVAALGKLALQQEATAHELLPSFGYLLNHSKDNALRHNILCALADLCGRSVCGFIIFI